MGEATPFIAGAAQIVVGAVLIYTGVGAPIGAALIASGIGTIASGVATSLADDKTNQSSFAVTASGNTATFRQAVTARRILYGEALISGPLILPSSSNGGRRLWYVIALCDGPIARIGTVEVDGDPIFDDQINASTGLVTAGRFASNMRIIKCRGSNDTEDNEARELLRTQGIPEVDADFNLFGVAWLAIGFDFSTELYPQTPQRVSAYCQGRLLFDPRDGGTRYSANSVLAIRDYLTDEKLGVGVDASRIPDARTIGEANICDEIIPTLEVIEDVEAVDVDGDFIDLVAEVCPFQTGDRVDLRSTLSPPQGVPIGSFAIVERQRQGRNNERPRIRFAATYADALARVSLDIIDAGTGDISVVKTGEPRYTASGLVLTDRVHADVLNDLNTSCGGSLVYSGGNWLISTSTYRIPEIEFDQDDIVSAITVGWERPAADRFNSIKGLYADPSLNHGEPADYPALTGTGFELIDGEVRWSDKDLPFTSRSPTAQRLTKMTLLRHRQEITVQATFSWNAGWKVLPTDVIRLTFNTYGWDQKEFEVVTARPVRIQEEGAPVDAMQLTLQETAAEAFDWDFTLDEQLPTDPAPDTNLPDPTSVLPPGIPTVVEGTYETVEAPGVRTQVIVQWDASPDPFLNGYEVQWRLVGTVDWNFSPRISTAQNEFVIRDLEPGLYSFRVRAINSLGIASDGDQADPWQAQIDYTVIGLAAPPRRITGLAGEIIGAAMVLRWDRHPDADVRRGGFIQFRHSVILENAAPNSSTSIGEVAPGEAIQWSLPMKPGTYFARAIDAFGVPALEWASFSSLAADNTPYTSSATIQEDPSFPTVPIGSLLRDAAGQSRDGTLNGLVSYSRGLLLRGAGLSFPGNETTSYVAVPGAVIDGLTDLSMALDYLSTRTVWNPGDRNTIFDNFTTASEWTLALFYDDLGGEDILEIFHASGGVAQKMTLTIRVNDGVPHRLVFRSNATTLLAELFVDGVLAGSLTLAGRVAIPTTVGGTLIGQLQSVLGGGFSAALAMHGTLDHFVIWPALLSDEQVATYTATANPRDLGIEPTVFYDCDDGGVVVVANQLQLDATGLVDDQPDWDNIPNFDRLGQLFDGGAYYFSTGFDFGGAVNARLEGLISAVVSNEADLIDDRQTPIDLWEDFDGAAPGSADAWLEVQTTQTDPTATPTWSPWRRLDASDVQAWGLRFRCRLDARDPGYNILIDQLRVTYQRT